MDAQSKRTRDRRDRSPEIVAPAIGASKCSVDGWAEAVRVVAIAFMRAVLFDWQLVTRKSVELIIGGTMRQVNPSH
jgi:hypothetical protein